MQVQVEHFHVQLDVADGQTILEAALDAGMDYPFACQQGQCGACKSVLLSGEVDMGSFYNPLVCTPAERRRGLVLACQARPLSNCVIAPLEIAGALLFPKRELECTVSELTRATRDILVMRLRVDAGAPFHFAAGQYAHVEFPGFPAREFSMASVPEEAELEFHVRVVPGGEVTPMIASRVKPGDQVRVTGPLGDAYLREEHLGPMLLVAGGSGLAPIKSIAQTALARGAAQPIHLYFGVRDEADVYMEAGLRSLAARHSNLRLTIALSGPGVGSARRVGSLDAIIGDDFDGFAGFRAYVCGAPQTCAAVRTTLLNAGLDSTMLSMDAFTTRHERSN